MMYLLVVWALVALIGQVESKCSLAPIVDDDRSIAYACIHGDLNDLKEISSEAEWIELSVSRFPYIPDNAFSRFRNLRRLSFYNCHVPFISSDAFAGLERLEWLVFHGTKAHVVRAAWFRHLPNLRRLVLDRCGLIHVEAETFRLLPRLEILELRDNDLDCLPVDQLVHLRGLRSARIDGNPWLCECRQQLERFFREKSILQGGHCHGSNICSYQCMTQIGIPVLPVSLTPRNLQLFERERVALRGSEFESTVFSSLDRLPDKTTWIEISGLRIEKIPRYGFFRFGNSLRSLDLNDCSIGSIEKGGLAGLHKLQRLSLTGNDLRTVGAEWFRDLVGLQQLVLRGNEIQQVERTAFWFLGNSLRHLDLRDNRLGCLAIEELAELKHLERADIVGNPWTCACARNLQKFLTEKNVGFEITSQCYETANETLIDFSKEPRIDERPSTGRVHWVSFEESIRDLNVTVRRPTGRPPTPTIRAEVDTPRPRAYNPNCHRDRKTDRIYTCSGINQLEELSLVPNTAHTIRIILSNIAEIPQDAFARFNGYLSRLELRDCGIERIADRAFSSLYNLEYLSLHNNQLDSLSSESVRGLTSLKHLDLSRNHIFRITNDVFDTLPYLITLDISENSMNCIGLEHMAHRLHHLRTLNVAENPWSCLCGTKLASYLQERGIHYNRTALVDRNEECYSSTVGGSPIPLSTPPLPTQSTSTPSASDSEQTVQGSCTLLQEDARRPPPRYVCVGGNLLLLETIPEDAIAIEFQEGHLHHLPAASFSRFRNLKELLLRNSGLRSVEENAFAGLDSLESLTIQDNPLESIASSWLPLGRLERLDLRGNSIRYIAPGAFRHLNRLVYLNLEGNDLRCIFTSDLNDMPDVHIVEFSGNPLKWRCRVELEQFLETRKIKFVKVENSCEGKKLVRNLLLQNQTDLASLDCSSDCSAAVSLTTHTFFALTALLPFYLIYVLPLI